jgi:hypothetical protein
MYHKTLYSCNKLCNEISWCLCYYQSLFTGLHKHASFIGYRINDSCKSFYDTDSCSTYWYRVQGEQPVMITDFPKVWLNWGSSLEQFYKTFFSSSLTFRVQSYKTSCGRNLQMFAISFSICPSQAFPAYST